MHELKLIARATDIETGATTIARLYQTGPSTFAWFLAADRPSDEEPMIGFTGHESIEDARSSLALDSWSEAPNLSIDYFEAVPHSTDEQCVLDADGVCIICDTMHGDPCHVCGGTGFHKSQCSERCTARWTSMAE